MTQFKEAWEKPRMSRGFVVSLVLIVAVAVACRLIFWDDWRAVGKHAYLKGSEEEAVYVAAGYLKDRCRLSHLAPSGTYDEAGKVWEVKGHCEHLGGPSKFTCRVYIGVDCEWHCESISFWWP